MRIYECPEHDQEWKSHPECDDCRRILEVIARREEALKLNPLKPRSHFRGESVYWPSKMGHMGRTIENLEHTPVHFDMKYKYREYLKRKNVREAG
jgi:hypothetical protein